MAKNIFLKSTHEKSSVPLAETEALNHESYLQVMYHKSVDYHRRVSCTEKSFF
jgi:hypothetical protein